MRHGFVGVVPFDRLSPTAVDDAISYILMSSFPPINLIAHSDRDINHDSTAAGTSVGDRNAAKEESEKKTTSERGSEQKVSSSSERNLAMSLNTYDTIDGSADALCEYFDTCEALEDEMGGGAGSSPLAHNDVLLVISQVTLLDSHPL